MSLPGCMPDSENRCRGRLLGGSVVVDDSSKLPSMSLGTSQGGAIEIVVKRNPNRMAEDGYALVDILPSESASPVTWLSPRRRFEQPE